MTRSASERVKTKGHFLLQTEVTTNSAHEHPAAHSQLTSSLVFSSGAINRNQNVRRNS